MTPNNDNFNNNPSQDNPNEEDDFFDDLDFEDDDWEEITSTTHITKKKEKKKQINPNNSMTPQQPEDTSGFSDIIAKKKKQMMLQSADSEQPKRKKPLNKSKKFSKDSLSITGIKKNIRDVKDFRERKSKSTDRKQSGKRNKKQLDSDNLPTTLVKTPFTDLFSIDNLKKLLSIEFLWEQKLKIALILFLIMPTIIFFSVAGVKTQQLVDLNGTKYNTYSYVLGEENLDVSLYNPIPRDLTADKYRMINLTIAFQKDSSTWREYILNDSYYWVYIHDITLQLYFKSEETNSFSQLKFFSKQTINQNLTFGDAISQEMEFMKNISEEDLADNQEIDWNYYKIRIGINLTDYSHDEYLIKYVDVPIDENNGRIINQNGIYAKYYNDGVAYAWVNLIYYFIFAGGFFAILYGLHQKKKYSFIKV